MKIAMLTSWFATKSSPLGGSFFLDQAAALAKRGHVVSILAPKLWALNDVPKGLVGPLGLTMPRVERSVEIREGHGIYLAPRHRWRDAGAFTRLSRRLYQQYVTEHGTPDAIIAQSALYAGYAAARLRHEGAPPFMVIEHLSRFIEGNLRPDRIAYARHAYAGAAVRCAVSRALARAMIACFRGDASPVEVVPNPIAEHFERSAVAQRSTAEPFTFVAVSRLSPEKNIDGMIRAFAATGQANTRLRIVGGGPRASMLHSLADRLAVSHRVEFIGEAGRADVIAALSRADAFVSSSYVETFGVAIVEALALGLPVIATDCGGPADIVGPEDGMLVPAGDETALARAMVQMAAAPFKNPQDRRERTLARFGTEVVGRRLEALLEQVTGVSGSGTA